MINDWTVGTPESVQFFDQIHKALLFWEQGSSIRVRQGIIFKTFQEQCMVGYCLGYTILPQTTMRHLQKRKDMTVDVL